MEVGCCLEWGRWCKCRARESNKRGEQGTWGEVQSVKGSGPDSALERARRGAQKKHGQLEHYYWVERLINNWQHSVWVSKKGDIMVMRQKGGCQERGDRHSHPERATQAQGRKCRRTEGNTDIGKEIQTTTKKQITISHFHADKFYLVCFRLWDNRDTYFNPNTMCNVPLCPNGTFTSQRTIIAPHPKLPACRKHASNTLQTGPVIRLTTSLLLLIT